jgi:hypothetical protein
MLKSNYTKIYNMIDKLITAIQENDLQTIKDNNSITRPMHIDIVYYAYLYNRPQIVEYFIEKGYFILDEYIHAILYKDNIDVLSYLLKNEYIEWTPEYLDKSLDVFHFVDSPKKCLEYLKMNGYKVNRNKKLDNLK